MTVSSAPLELIEKAAKSPFISRGIEVPALDRHKKWDFKPAMKVGENVTGGDVLGTVQETVLIEHRVMVPPALAGTLRSIKSGVHTIEEVIAQIETQDGKTVDVQMLQRWPIRIPRPVKQKDIPRSRLQRARASSIRSFPLRRVAQALFRAPSVRENGHAAGACKVLQRAGDRLHRLRRTRQRDDGSALRNFHTSKIRIRASRS